MAVSTNNEVFMKLEALTERYGDNLLGTDSELSESLDMGVVLVLPIYRDNIRGILNDGPDDYKVCSWSLESLWDLYSENKEEIDDFTGASYDLETLKSDDIELLVLVNSLNLWIGLLHY